MCLWNWIKARAEIKTVIWKLFSAIHFTLQSCLLRISSSSYPPQPALPSAVAGMAGLLTVDSILSCGHCPRWHCTGDKCKPSGSGTRPSRPESSGRESRTPPQERRYFGRRRRFWAPACSEKRVCASSSPCRTDRTPRSSPRSPPLAPAGRRAGSGKGSVSRNAPSSPGWRPAGGSRTGSSSPCGRSLQRRPRLRTDTPGNRPSPGSLSGTRWWSWGSGACWAYYSS